MNQLQMLKTALIAYVNSVKEVWSVLAHPLSIFSKRKGEVKDYRIYGNSVQDGTPTHEEPIEVQSVGELTTKNLLDTPKITLDYYASYEQNGDLVTIKGNVPSEKFASSGGFIKFAIPNNEDLPSGQYTFSVNITLLEAGDFGADLRMYSGSSSKPTEKYTDWKNITLNKELRISCSGTYSSGFNSATIRVNGCKILIDVGSLQIEEGTIATEYEPYHKYKVPVTVRSLNSEIEPQTVNIYLDEPLRQIGDYADVVDYDGRKVVRKIKRETITEISSASGDVTTYKRFTTPISAKPLLTDSGTSAKGMAISNKFQSIFVEYKNLGGYGGVIMPYITTSKKNTVALTFTDTSIKTLEKAQSAISDGFEVYYILNEPIDESLTLPELPQFKGTTIYEVQTEVPPSGIDVCYYE